MTTTLANNTTGILSSSITSGTTTGVTTTTPYMFPSPNTSTGVYYQPPPALLLKDAPMTYESDHSDRKTYQHEVAVIKVFRNDDGVVTKSKIIKTIWVETKTQGSIDYAASKDPEVSEYEPEDIIIKTLRTIIL
jgi:hypothetical protein